MVLKKYSENDLEIKAKEIKLKCAELCIRHKKGHLTSALSCAELLTVLYYNYLNIRPNQPDWLARDRFIMSKNHGSVITYPILMDLGYFSEEFLNSYQENGSELGTHSKVQVPGVEFSGGSLGIGLGVACGLAYASQNSGENWKTYCMVGDCECHEGSIWESIMFAGHYKLENLIVIMDRNDEGCTDFIDNLIPLSPLKDKFEAFGWETYEIKDGHNITQIINAYNYAADRKAGKPLLIYANTIKGNGIDFMLNKPWLHGQVPTGTDGEIALSMLKEDLRDVIK